MPRRKRNGNLPDSPRKLVAQFVLDDIEWQMWERLSMSYKDWVSLKVIAATKVRGKANYWLGWNRREQRLARTVDAMSLGENLSLLNWVLRVLRTKRKPK